MSLNAPPAAGDTRDDFHSDFIPDIPLRPLDEIVSDSPGDDDADWRDDFFGDPGEVTQPEPVVSDDVRPSAEVPREPADTAELPEGWHRIDAMGLRLSVPSHFDLLRDPDGEPMIEEGANWISEATLEEMAQMGAQGEPTETVNVIMVGRTPRAELDEFLTDESGVTVLDRRELVLGPELSLAWLVLEGDMLGFFAHVHALESTMPLPDDSYLSVMAVTTRPTPEAAEQMAQIIERIALSPDAPDGPDDTDAPGRRSEIAAPGIAFFEGALTVALPDEDWRASTARDDVATFRSTGGYQGFVSIERGARASPPIWR